MEGAHGPTRHRWALALRGLVAILFGLAALIWPEITLLVLVVLFGAYALIDGVFAIVAAVRSVGRNSRWWWYLAEGIAGILAGLAAFFWPGVTALVLLYLIAVWAIVTGAIEMVVAFQLNEWSLFAAGVLSVLFGLLLILFPGAGAVSVVWLIGIYALIFGVLMLVHAFQTRHEPSPA